MAAAVQITRLDLDAASPRRAAQRSRDAAAARRMLALALVLKGASRTQAAQAARMDRQTLRNIRDAASVARISDGACHVGRLAEGRWARSLIGMVSSPSYRG